MGGPDILYTQDSSLIIPELLSCCVDPFTHSFYTCTAMLLGLDSGSYRLAAGLGEWRPHQSPPMRLEHFFRKAAELGLQGVAISDLRLLEKVDYGALCALRRQADEFHLFLKLIYTGLQPEQLQDIIRIGGALGCREVCFVPAFERPPSAESMRNRLEEVAQIISLALPVAERYAIGLALGSCSLTAAELNQLRRAAGSDALSFYLDPLAALRVLEEPLVWARRLAHHTSVLRLSDYQIVPEEDGARLVSCSFGRGIVNLTGLLEVLQRASPRAHLILSTPDEELPLPFLEERFLARLHQLRPAQLARIVRLTRDRGSPAPPAPQLDRSSEDEILAWEDDRFEDSLDWLREQ